LESGNRSHRLTNQRSQKYVQPCEH